MTKSKYETFVSRYILYRYNWKDYFEQGRIYKIADIDKFKGTKKEYVNEYSSLKDFLNCFYRGYRAGYLSNTKYLGVKTSPNGLRALSRLKDQDVVNIDTINTYLCNHMWDFDRSIMKMVDIYKIKLDNGL